MPNSREKRNSNSCGKRANSSEFLQILFDKYIATQSRGLVEIRPIKGRDRPGRSFFFEMDEIGQLSQQIQKLNRQGYNIYFSVNPRPRNKNKKQKFIKDIICLWLDVDAKNFDGGKEEALGRIKDFPIRPNIIVDSGNGYHAYWILDEPLINRTEQQSLEIQQILNGLINTIGADRRRKNFDSLMRLPGTLNVKKPENPLECNVVEIYAARFYSLSDFVQFRDLEFSLQEEEVDVGLDFGNKNITIRGDELRSAVIDVRQLKVGNRIKGMIISGALQSAPGKDPTKSGRDQSIITALISAGYTFETIKSIFLNIHLKCSDRLNGDLSRLIWDVKSAKRFLDKGIRHLSPAQKAVYKIEHLEINSREKIQRMCDYIVGDLIKGEDRIGAAYINKARKAYYIFEKEQKLLIDTDTEDFKYFLVNRYALLDKDLKEVLRAIQSAVYEMGEEIEPHKFAYYDKTKHILYISNHNNQIYRLDGSRIILVDNGTDGIIFEFRPDYNPFVIDETKIAEIPNYFQRGFSWRRFSGNDSWVYKYLVQRANFSTEETHDVSVEEQKYLLTIYFYSLFFESLQGEKPILCFVGVKSSGKSFVATAIGRVFFGDSFFPNHLSASLRDFNVLLSENSYVVFDNLDSSIYQFMDAFCAAATGAEISSRKLFTDREEIKLKPHVFIVITSREPKFRRDDFVDRLILLNTELVRQPMSRSALFGELSENRDIMMTEVLVNLNSIIMHLKRKSSWNPPCEFRIADWELFGRKVHNQRGGGGFVDILKKMNREKSKFGLEEDPLYLLLHHEIYGGRPSSISDKSTSELFEMLVGLADTLKIKDFSKRYKNSISLGRRLTNIKEELKEEFDFQVRVGRMRQKHYSIGAKSGEDGEDNQ